MQIVIACSILTLIYACDIGVELVSQSDGPVYAQFEFYNGTKSEVYHFKRKDQKKTLRIKDTVCNLQPTTLKTYTKHPETGVKPTGQTSAFIEGIGSANYLVYNDSVPRMGMRLGVMCGFGDCGGRAHG